jgi:hypothetical protein
MIIQEHFDVDGKDFVRTTSNSGRYVVRDGISYSEACDPAEFGCEYTEGDLMPEEERDMTELADKAEAYDILMGGAV